MNRLAIVITAVLLTAHNLCLAIAQEKTEYDYGGGDYEDYGSDYGQNGLYGSGDIVVKQNPGEGNSAQNPGEGNSAISVPKPYQPRMQRQPVLWATSRKLSANKLLHSNGMVTRRVGNTYYHSFGGSTREINSHTFVHSWGGTTRRVGNTYYHSNGGYYIRQGNYLYHYR